MPKAQTIIVVPVTSNADISPETIATLIKKLIDVGLADAQATIEGGEGDMVIDAVMATSLNITSPTVLKSMLATSAPICTTPSFKADESVAVFQNVETFLQMLEGADAVKVDGGSLLDSWETSEAVGDPENQIVEFSWTDGFHDYSEKLTESGIAAGQFDSEGNFTCENYEGDLSTISFYKFEQLRPQPVTEVAGQTPLGNSVLMVSLDDGETFQDAPSGVRVMCKAMDVPGEDGSGELHLNVTDEGIITDLWVTRDEPLDHNIGTSSEMFDQIIGRLALQD